MTLAVLCTPCGREQRMRSLIHGGHLQTPGANSGLCLCDLQSLLHARDLYVLDGLYCLPRTQSSQGGQGI